MLSRGEFLTAYTPYQPEMSQGVLQAIFEYQTVICELTGMDVSNASGYDGTTVAADACFVAKHASDRRKVVLAEALNPQVRQVVKTYAPGFGLEVVEVPHRGGSRIRTSSERPRADAAAVIFQQPNFFGCLEPAADLAEAARDAGAHADRTRRSRLARAYSRRRASTAVRWRSARGRAAVHPSYGGPHYGFFAARQDFVRRMPGRIVGETVDADGRRAFVLTLQTREQHIRREKATSNITTNQTLLALAGLVTLSWLGPEGLRDVGETCLALSQYAREHVPLEPAFEAASFKEVAFRTPVPAREVIRRARQHGVHPGYALGRDYEAMEDVLLVAVTERRTPDEIHRLAEVLEEVCG